MTEAEWLIATDPTPLFEFIWTKTTARKLRLFGCACCRRSWPLATEITRSLIELAERYADKQFSRERITRSQLFAALTEADASKPRSPGSACALEAAKCLLLFRREALASVWAARAAIDDARTAEAEVDRHHERAFQATMLRDVTGDPFRPVGFDPTWLTSTATVLARQMYESRDFSAMPILADALQDAGCDNTKILDHCRLEGVHVRGCWALDLILGKS